jgi:hypothetical protein
LFLVGVGHWEKQKEVSRKDAKTQRKEAGQRLFFLVFKSLRLGVLSEAGVRFIFQPPPGMGKAAVSGIFYGSRGLRAFGFRW